MSTLLLSDRKAHRASVLLGAWFGLLVALTCPPAFSATPPAPTPQPPPQDDQSDEAAALERLAEERFAEDDLPGARAFYIQASRTSSGPREQARLLVNAAWLAHLLGSIAEAEYDLEEALNVDPEFPFDRALYRPDFANLYEEAKRRVTARRDKDHNRRISDAVQAIDQGDLARARVLLERASSDRPDDATTAYNLALLDLREGRVEAAQSGFRRVADVADADSVFVAPTLHARALNQLGLLELNRGDWSLAVKTLEEAVAVDPQNGSAWNNLGLAHHSLGRFGSAAKAFEQAVKRSGDQAPMVRNLGLALVEAGQYDRANELLVLASERYPEDAQIWLTLGRARLGRGQPEVAVGDFERALRHSSGEDTSLRAEAWAQLAQARYDVGSAEEAVEAAQQALALRENNPHSWHYQGMAQRRLGRADEAVASFERAHQLDPRRADILNNLGDAYFQTSRFEDAVRAFELALVEQPDMELAASNLEIARQRIAQGSAQKQSPETELSAQEAETKSRARVTSTDTLPSTASAPAKPSVETTGTIAQSARADTTSAETKRRKRRRDRQRGQKAEQRRNVGLELDDARDQATGLVGAVVTGVSSEGPGAQAGLEVGDLILRVDGRPIQLAQRLLEELERQPAGSTVRLDLLRNGEPRRVELVH